MKRTFLSFLFSLLLYSPCHAALTDSLIAFWSLDETSGTRNDSHGTNNLTEVDGVGSATGKVGNAALFVGSGTEDLHIADNAALSTGNLDFTFAGWIYLNVKGASDRPIIAKADGSGAEYLLQWDSATDRFLWILYSGDSFAGQTIVSANNFGAPATSTWYFIVAWHDSVGDTIQIQVNNGTANSTAFSAGSWDSTKSLFLGAVPGFGQLLDGRMDQWGFWKRLLTGTEKTFLYNSNNGRSYAEIVAEGGGVAAPGMLLMGVGR